MVTPPAPDARPDPLAIGIVGLGPRGLTVLERILTLAAHAPDRRFEVAVFEPGEPGTGLHSPGQPDYLLLNTIACQLSMFPDAAALGAPEERRGPNFFEWCLRRNVRIGEDGLPCGAGGRAVRETDFLPRRLLGEYLLWTFRTLMATAPPNVSVTIHRERAVEAVPRSGPAGFVLRGESGIEATVSRLFVCLGHTGRRSPAGSPAAKEIAAPYPLPAATDAIPPGAATALGGFGLAAMDVLAGLTVGRGGRHVRRDGRQVYLPSGREPKIILFSRTGIPFRTRPDTTPDRKKFQPLVLTPAAIAELRTQTADGRLDFERAVLPLLKQEMLAAYHIASAGLSGDGAAAALREVLSVAARAGRLDAEFPALAERHGTFSPDDHLLLTAPEGLSGDEYVRWVRNFIEADLAESSKGLARSPIKAALEVWRDLRDVLRSIVDFRGLDEASHEYYFGTVAQLSSRLVTGPQKERYEDLLAVMDAGIAEIFPGIDPTIASLPDGRISLRGKGDAAPVRIIDHVVRARLATPGLIDTDSHFLTALGQAGLIRPRCARYGLDGIDVDALSHPLGAPDGLAKALWIFGPNVEGASYYNHYVPSSGAYSRAFADAHRAAVECMTADEKLPATA